ncbi:hypothetical protein EV182_000772 [Spiromyces aspiralis]|uniref:Uncharacterized protein n=1 Tax=Spiromyces aspiralis TaxID=68401 RepID=A0ACC1HGJ1_9FUNG|nr:hypothetical protein EV182_000772 [Spiromyces aspiralis]
MATYPHSASEHDHLPWSRNKCYPTASSPSVACAPPRQLHLLCAAPSQLLSPPPPSSLAGSQSPPTISPSSLYSHAAPVTAPSHNGCNGSLVADSVVAVPRDKTPSPSLLAVGNASQDISPLDRSGAATNIEQLLAKIGFALPRRRRQPIPPKRAAHRPHAPNSFIIYRCEKSREIASLYPDLTQSQLSRIVGNMWHNEPEEVKAMYRLRQRQVKLRHACMLRHGGGDDNAIKHTPYRRNRRRRHIHLPNDFTADHEQGQGPSSPPLAGKSAEVSHINRHPRPPINTFFKYRNYIMDQLTRAEFEFSQTELSKISSKLWQLEPPHVQDWFRREYQQEKLIFDRHLQQGDTRLTLELCGKSPVHSSQLLPTPTTIPVTVATTAATAARHTSNAKLPQSSFNRLHLVPSHSA